MKTEKRTVKAFVVIVIVGYGAVRNIDFKSAYSTFSNDISQNEQFNDSNDTNSNKLSVYTSVVIKTGIKNFLLNL